MYQGHKISAQEEDLGSSSADIIRLRTTDLVKPNWVACRPQCSSLFHVLL